MSTIAPVKHLSRDRLSSAANWKEEKVTGSVLIKPQQSVKMERSLLEEDQPELYICPAWKRNPKQNVSTDTKNKAPRNQEISVADHSMVPKKTASC